MAKVIETIVPAQHSAPAECGAKLGRHQILENSVIISENTIYKNPSSLSENSPVAASESLAPKGAQGVTIFVCLFVRLAGSCLSRALNLHLLCQSQVLGLSLVSLSSLITLKITSSDS